MDLITIDKEKLRELFVEAYEAGWHGSKELASSAAEELVKKAAVAIGPSIDWDGSKGTWQNPPYGPEREDDVRVEYVTSPTFTLNPGDYDAPEVNVPPPQAIEIEQEGQIIEVAGWEIRWPPEASTFFLHPADANEE